MTCRCDDNDVSGRSARGQRARATRLVVHTEDGRLDDESHRSTLERLRKQLAGADDVAAVSDPLSAISEDGTTSYVDVAYTIDAFEPVHFEDFSAAAGIARAEGVGVEVTGALAAIDAPAPTNELIGIVIAVIVLLVAFGSVVAMGLTIVSALFGIFVGLTAVGLLSAFLDVPELSLILCVMVGLGVGIDYALFIVTRHRQQLHEGMSVEDSAATANATAGMAVLFAGTTVVIAILGLFVIGVPSLQGTAAAVAVVVAVAMLAAITLLPGLLGLAGTKIDKLSIHRRSHVAKPAHATFSGRWAHHIGARPVRYALASLAVLVVIAVPAVSMRIGVADDGNAAPHTTQRKGYDQLAEAFGPGFNGPIHVVVQLSSTADAVAVDRVRQALEADAAIAQVTPPMANVNGDTVLFTANPTTSPQDTKTDILVQRLRRDVLPGAVAGTGATAMLTGQAMVTDLSERVSDRLPFFITAIVGLSFVLLMIVFRSLLVPLKAAAMNLLSIAAAYGVVVAVFQWGWGKELIGLEHTMPINPFMPVMMFAILFGLSMDYEVFLLSRVREEYVASGDSRGSVVQGLSSTARVITSAALIMISVFGAFVLGDDPLGKMFGVGLSVAVLLDATLVRMVLVPATMSLAGRANWWLPRWLDRVMPHVDLEGEVHDVESVASHPAPELVTI
ncbi:MAG TPA: MMPL family transporter [Acidimicrobiales bacterium]|nr:MMPL family transporter [Acidimicrobiales bacterium]